MTWEPRVYRALLRIYPQAFRERHGAEMLRVYTEKLEEAGSPWTRARARIGGLWDVVVNGLAERIAAGKTSSSAGGGMDGFVKDVGYAARALRRSPGFAAVAIVTIALGIGANAALFSVVQGVLLAPLPYEQPEELVMLWGEMVNRDVYDFPHSPPDFLDYREQADRLEELAGVMTWQVALTGDGDPERISAGVVTPNFFRTMGVEPLLGRDFTEADGAPGEDGQAFPSSLTWSVILGHGLWRQRFGGDPAVLGRTVEIGGSPAEIVGVAPEGFRLLLPEKSGLASHVDLWLAARLDYRAMPRNNAFLRAVGRLAEGVTLEEAQAQVDRVAARIVEIDPVKVSFGYGARLEPLHDDVTEAVRPTLTAMFGAVVFVLLIACANVSNLLLVRASSREREMAVRASMGGTRGRLARQMLVESAVLAGIGGALGLVLAAAGVRLLTAFPPAGLPRLDSVGLDGPVLAFTALATMGAAMLFGLLPAVQASKAELADALKDRGPSGAAGRRVVREGVIVAEVALSVVLLIGAGLMVRSFVELSRVDPGFRADGVLTFDVPVPPGRYPTASERADLSARLLGALEAVPGVLRASAISGLPLDGMLFNGRYGEEEALADPDAYRQAAYRAVLPGYFDVMGTRLLAGRTFTAADQADSARTVVIDEKLARTLWPDRSAVGERLLVRAVTPESEWVDVIGVVEHQRHETLAQEGMETIFMTDRYLGGQASSWVVRADGDPMRLVPSVREAIASVDPDLPVADVRPMAALVARSRAPTRFALALIGVFGLMALTLASVGLYGVLSYTARQRSGEIGIRMAFGARASSILRMVVAQGLTLAVLGVALGVAAAWVLTGAMRSLLVGVRPTDPLTFVGITAVFLVVATAACWIPARRAARVDPCRALRAE